MINIVEETKLSIKVLEGLMPEGEGGRQCFLIAINAMKKQIPVKPIYDDETAEYIECPVCKGLIAFMDEPQSHKHCLLCGQAFDWGC